MVRKVTPDTGDSIHKVGHRAFVGGRDDYWQKVGDVQFQYLCSAGLKQSDVYLDIACGSLRGGQHFIRYLEPGHYLGLDKHIELIIYGVAAELGLEAFRERRPRFVVSATFQFDKFDRQPNFALAQSLFTHLSPADIAMCLRSLKRSVAPNCRFFATYIESNRENPAESNSCETFRYTRSEMERMGEAEGWLPTYIGDWNHPRGQLLMEYRLP